MKKYYIYENAKSYNKENPDVILDANLVEKGKNYFTFKDEKNLEHYISLNNVISIVFKDDCFSTTSIITKKLYIYLSTYNYDNSSPDVILEGNIINKADNYIEIKDLEGYIHYVSLLKPIAVVEEQY